MQQIILGIDAAFGNMGQHGTGNEGIQAVGEEKKTRLPRVGRCLLCAVGTSETGVARVGVGIGNRLIEGEDSDLSERFPANPRIVVDGCVYVQCDCTGRAHDVITNTGLGLSL